MNIREYLNNNSAVSTVVAVGVLVIALAIIVWTTSGGGNRITDVYFYDMNTRTIFAGEATDIAPLETDSGPFTYGEAGSMPAGVRAYVFSCESCDDIEGGMTLQEVEAAGGFVAYIERYNERARELYQRLADGEELTDEEYMSLTMNARLISNLEGQRWVPAESGAGMRLMESVDTCDEGQTVEYCTP